MSVVIRLARQGAKHRDFWRMVVTESRSPRDGRFIEMIGYYDPLTNPATIKVKADRAQYWIGVGARPSDKARVLLKKSGALTQEALDRALAEKAEKAAAHAAEVAAQEAQKAAAHATVAADAPVAADTDAAQPVVES